METFNIESVKELSFAELSCINGGGETAKAIGYGIGYAIGFVAGGVIAAAIFILD